MMFVLVALMVVDIAAGFVLVVVAVGEALVLRTITKVVTLVVTVLIILKLTKPCMFF